MMKEIAELLAIPHDDLTDARSISYRLEQAVDGYFVRGERPGRSDPWLTVYYDARYEYNDYNSLIELVPENIAAYVAMELRFAFVRADIMERFREDVHGCGLACAPIDDFAAKALCCADPNALPAPLNGLTWRKSGGHALDPAGFSVRELVTTLNEAEEERT